MYICSKPIFCHFPVSVFRVTLVWRTVPLRRDPDSTFPPATGRERRLSPATTVKLANGRSHGLRVATLGEPSLGQSSLVDAGKGRGLCVLGLTEVLRHNLVFTNRQQEITAVIPILPLQDVALADALFRCGVGDGQGPLLAVRANCRSSKFYTEGTGTGSFVVTFFTIPN